MSPLISIVMPVFDCQNTLERALLSIKRQNYPRLEVIFMDGKSRDKTMQVAGRHKALFKHIISEPDNGQTDALNKGFRLATGDVFCWLNGDDAFKDGALQHVAELFDANQDKNMVIGTSQRIYADGSKEVIAVGKNVLDMIGYRNGIDQPSCFWRADLHRKAGELDESYDFSMDWDWWNRLKKTAGDPVVTDKILSVYYFSDDNKTASQPEGNVREMYKVIKLYGPQNGELADAYLKLYEEFDLKGCYDNPPSAPMEVMEEWWKTLDELYKKFGKGPINAYNWNWCSKQVRGGKISAPSRKERIVRPFVRRIYTRPVLVRMIHRLWARSFFSKKS